MREREKRETEPDVKERGREERREKMNESRPVRPLGSPKTLS